MQSVRWDGARWTALVAFWFVLLALPTAARASLSWSPAVAVDTRAAGTALGGVSCPTTDQCTAIDGHGREITFNPQSPTGATGSAVASTALTAIACPAATQCTAVDSEGQQVTFDPQSPGEPAPTTIDAGGVLLSVACPLPTQCTAVNASGGEVTFDPQSPGMPSVITIDSGNAAVLAGVSCASPTQCSAVDVGGQEVTFNPQAGQVSSLGPVAGSSPVAIACPTADQCDAVDSGGGAETFDPGNPGGASTTTIDASVALTSLSCLAVQSGTECVAMDVHGNGIVAVVLTLGSSSSILAEPPAGIDSTGIPTGVSCPVGNQCTAVDTSGNEVTFNPGTPTGATPVAIDGTTTLTGLACETASQCTAVDVYGIAATFAPGSSAPPTLGAIDTRSAGVYGVACPTAAQCTAVDIGGGEVTFDPNSPGTPTPVSVDPGRSLYGLACPVATQCTAVDDLGNEVTFNPQSPGAPAVKAIESGLGLSGVACPMATQCTATDVAGDEVTFNPESPGASRIARIDSNPAVAVTCPAATQCSAVDTVGREVLFDPRSPGGASTTTLDPTSQLNAIACRTPTDCVAVDSVGRAYEGDPRGVGRWSLQQIAGGSPVAAVACPSALECVAVDTSGYQFVGSSGPLPPVPRRISRPKIAGTPRAGRVLHESHGRWSGGATSFRYQWQRCNRAGRACASIPGATGQKYVLVARDAGRRIRVLESAFNISGAGPPAQSAATAMVRPRVAVAATRLSLSGVAERKPRLAFTVTAGPGEPPLDAIAVRLAGFLDVSQGNAALQQRIGVDARGRTLEFSAGITGHTLSLNLRKSSMSVRITIGAAVLATSAPVARRVRAHKLTSVTMLIVVTETRGAKTQLHVRVPVS
jgi:hypothetical protein